MNRNNSCIILGGGGHARMLIEILNFREVPIIGIFDKNQDKWGKENLGVPILGGDDLLPDYCDQASWFAVGLGGIGDNRPRQHLFEYAISLGFKPLTIIHPTAIVSKYVELGSGSQLLPGCIVNSGVVLGNNVIINSGAIIEHDCHLGNHVHVATGGRLASTVTVNDGAHVGAGATIRQLITIGANSIVGAGAVVVKDVESGSVVVGVPAREIRRKNKEL